MADASSADLIVIGGGFGGLIAALRARELGLDVVLLEKGDGERYPCNSRMSGGIIHICLLDIRRTPEELFNAILKGTSGAVNKVQAKALTENASRMVDWLLGHGARFMRFNMQEAYRWCMAPPRALVPGPDWIDRGPDVLLRDLMKKFIGAGGRAMLRTKALRVIMKNGICNGVVAEKEGNEIEYHSAAVIIADGGFQADRASFEANIGPNFGAIFQRGAATSMGDGMRMAEAAGARLTDRRPFYGHLLAREVHANSKLWPYPELDAFTTAGVIVGADGKRVVNEGAGGIAVANALARLPDPGGTTAIFDAGIWEGPGKAHRIPANPLLEQAGATIYRADSLAELARQLNIPAETLASTIAQHNAAIDSGNFASLTPSREGPIKAYPIHTPPYMAIRVVPGITYTMGGIEIDGAGRVVSTSGAPIPGLFAAGAATGGLEGGGQNAYIGGIVKAATFGLLAAEEISRNIKTTEIDLTASFATEKFPTLRLTVDYGLSAAKIIAPLVALLIGWLCWPVASWAALPIGLAAGGLVYLLLRTYVELVTLITEMLMPR